MYSYSCARLILGLLIKNADDAVREGDGDRIIRCWRFFMLYYKAYGHHKYAIAAFRLLANISSILTEEKAHRLIWNRTISNKGGKGKNMSNDVRLEMWNGLTKELLGHLGVNLDEKCASREAKAIAFVEDMLLSIDEDLCMTRLTGKHTVKKKDDDTKALMKDMKNRDIFSFKPGRHYEKFCNFDKQLLSKMDVAKFANWLKDQRKQLMREHVF